MRRTQSPKPYGFRGFLFVPIFPVPARRFALAVICSLLLHGFILLPTNGPVAVSFQPPGRAMTLAGTLHIRKEPGEGAQGRERQHEKEVVRGNGRVSTERRVSRESTRNLSQSASMPKMNEGDGATAVPATVVVPAQGERSFRLRLARAARELRRETATYGGLRSGSVELRVAMGLPGGLPRVTVIRSSGDKSLDEQTRSLIERAVLRTEVPESLRGRPLNLAVLLEYQAD